MYSAALRRLVQASVAARSAQYDHLSCPDNALDGSLRGDLLGVCRGWTELSAKSAAIWSALHSLHLGERRRFPRLPTRLAHRPMIVEMNRNGPTHLVNELVDAVSPQALADA